MDTTSHRIRRLGRRGDLDGPGHLPEPPLQAGHRGALETGWPALGEGLRVVLIPKKCSLNLRALFTGAAESMTCES